MSRPIRDEMRHFAVFQPSAYSRGIQSYRPHTRTRLRESRGAYGPGPANGYGLLATYFAATVLTQTKPQKAASTAQSEFKAGKTYPSTQSLVAASRQWGQPMSTTPTTTESAQFKVATVIYMIGMLDGLSPNARQTIGKLADGIYNKANAWYSVDSSDPASVSEVLAGLVPSANQAASAAVAGGASASSASELARYVGAIQESTTPEVVEHRQGLEEDTTLTGQAKDIAEERLDDMTDWACFASSLIGVNESVCPPETTKQKAARYAVYAAGAFILGGLVLYAGRPYVEVVQSFFDGEE